MNNPTNDLQDKENKFLSEVEAYAKAEFELARLQVIENTSRLVGSLLLSMCLVLALFAILAFCAVAAVVALAHCLPLWAACLIVGGFYLLLIPILIACSEVLFVNPIVRKLSGLKNSEELKYETLRAEGRAAVQRERINGHLRFVEAMYNYSAQLLRTAWSTIRSLFSK